jgi:hypothetical protein
MPMASLRLKPIISGIGSVGVDMRDLQYQRTFTMQRLG